MTIDTLRRLQAHGDWADRTLLDRLRAAGDAAPEALREYAHLLAAAEVWLARLERRRPRSQLWPGAPIDDVARLRDETAAGFGRFLDRLREDDLDTRATYTNSAGREFATPVGEILLHVALHGQYHRGKVNLLLRQAGQPPAPADYIAFVRGAPAAVTPRE